MNDDLRKFLDRAERNHMDARDIARRLASENERIAIRSSEEIDRKNAHLRQLQSEIEQLRAERDEASTMDTASLAAQLRLIADQLEGVMEFPAFHDERILGLRRIADEIERLRKGGRARDQRTTQFCAEAQLRAELERVKQIARARLTKIHDLQLELAQIEDDPRRLEDHGGLWGAECRGELDE